MSTETSNGPVRIATKQLHLPAISTARNIEQVASTTKTSSTSTRPPSHSAAEMEDAETETYPLNARVYSCKRQRRPPPLEGSVTTSSDSDSDSYLGEDEGVRSPCSSASSDHCYERVPGFTHHGHSFNKQAVKKKKFTIEHLDDFIITHTGNLIFPKQQTKPASLPMRLRALPQSFWQQPNNVNSHNNNTTHVNSNTQLSPYTVLPPLFKDNKDTDLTELQPITPNEEKYRQGHATRFIRVGNTDLLFKLFENIPSEKKTLHIPHSPSIPRKGRSRKVPTSKIPVLLRGDDPYMVDVVTEGLLPMLSLEKLTKAQAAISAAAAINNNNNTIECVKDDGKNSLLPALQVDQNYSAMLTELVAHI